MRDQCKADGSIILKLYKVRICEFGLYLPDLGYEREPGFFKSGNEIMRSTQGWEIDPHKR
jgi:hypothetical protein